MMIPYICPDLPEPQRKGLSYLVKSPLVYTHVAISNWTSFQKLGVHQIVSPGSYHCFTHLDFPVSIGDYHFPSHPDEPMVLFMLRTPCKPGLSARAQNRAGRIELMGTPFDTFERNIRAQLGAMLGPTGLRSRARHRGHHGEPLGARLRVHAELAVGSGMERRRAALGDRTPAVRPDCDCEFGFRGNG